MRIIESLFPPSLDYLGANLASETNNLSLSLNTAPRPGWFVSASAQRSALGSVHYPAGKFCKADIGAPSIGRWGNKLSLLPSNRPQIYKIWGSSGGESHLLGDQL